MHKMIKVEKPDCYDDNITGKMSSDYFTSVVFPVIRTNESQNCYKTMMKYIEFFNGKQVINSVDITSFVRNLYFNTGLIGKPLSKKYISNVLLVIIPELRRTGRLTNDKMDFKTLWSNIKKERNIHERQMLSNVDPDVKFTILNSNPTEYFKLNNQTVRDILFDCRKCLVLNDPENLYTDTDRQCFSVLVLSIGTGARVVSTILKLSRMEIYKLFDTGVVTCTAKHTNRCDIYIADGIRTEFKDYFTNTNRTYPISITRRILVYWYKNYILKKFDKKLPPGHVLHEFRAWFIGHINDTMGIRTAAKSVSHKNIHTTLSYVNRSVYNVDVSTNISKAFKEICA